MLKEKMDRITKLRNYYKETLPENHLLNLASHGLNIQNITLDETETTKTVFNNIKHRHFKLLFPWFWTHKHVIDFYAEYQNEFNSEDVKWYLSQLYNVMSIRRDIHWLERVNLFHAFGLSRLVDDKGAILSIIENKFGYNLQPTVGNINTMTDMSAYNVIAMLRFNDIEESVIILRKIKENPRILSMFALYQIYYYGSIEKVVDIMKVYLNEKKMIMIPQSITAILWLFKNEDPKKWAESSMIIREELLNKMPKVIKYEINNILEIDYK